MSVFHPDPLDPLHHLCGPLSPLSQCAFTLDNSQLTWRTENFLPQPYTLSFTNWLLRTTGDLSDRGTGRRLHKEITSTLVTHPNKIIVQGRQMQIIICFDKYMLEKGNLSAEKIYILIELRFLPQGQLA